MDPADTTPPMWYWVVSCALLLWGLAGASIYIAYFIETPTDFAATAETAENAQAYAAYVANIPAWAIAVGVVAALTRLLGAMCLLTRRRWALPFYVASLAFFLVAMFRAFVLANAADVMSAAHIGVELLFIGLTVFAIWFARRTKSIGMLR